MSLNEILSGQPISAAASSYSLMVALQLRIHELCLYLPFCCLISVTLCIYYFVLYWCLLVLVLISVFMVSVIF